MAATRPLSGCTSMAQASRLAAGSTRDHGNRRALISPGYLTRRLRTGIYWSDKVPEIQPMGEVGERYPNDRSLSNGDRKTYTKRLTVGKSACASCENFPDRLVGCFSPLCGNRQCHLATIMSEFWRESHGWIRRIFPWRSRCIGT